MYEILLRNLDICGTAETCTGCSMRSEDKVPECYQRLMMMAAYALRERLKEEEKMIHTDDLLRRLVELMRNTVTNKEAYIGGLNTAMFIAMTLSKGKKEEGVYVVKYPKDMFSVTIYLILAQGIKITEALRECQKSILYALNKKYPKLCKEVNVYAIGLR